MHLCRAFKISSIEPGDWNRQPRESCRQPLAFIIDHISCPSFTHPRAAGTKRYLQVRQKFIRGPSNH